MKREAISSRTMGACDTLAETLLVIGGVLYSLEAEANGPSLYRERATSLAALGERLVRDAQQQAERLLEALRQPQSERRKSAKEKE